jgi:hypothetical protein
MAKKLLAMSVALIVGGLGLVITVGTQAAHSAAALNGFNDWNALVNTDQPQTLAARTFHVSHEMTINDVRQARLVLLEGIDNAILRLIKSEPKAMDEPRGMFDTTHIAQLLKTDQLDEAIVELDKLQAKVIKVFDQEAADKEVVPQIQNLIASLKQV